MEEEKNVLKGEDALALARQGAEVWNEWAVEHDGWSVDFSSTSALTSRNSGITFDQFIFPGGSTFNGSAMGKNIGFSSVVFKGVADFGNVEFLGNASFFETEFSDSVTFMNANVAELADFSSARFGGYTNFMATRFRGEALFDGAIFHGDTNFNDAVSESALFLGGSAFYKTAVFDTMIVNSVCEISDVTFHKDASFVSCKFNSALMMEGTEFGVVPDFRSTKMENHVSMDNIEVNFNGQWLCRFWRASEKDQDAAKYRRRKEMAILAQDHRQEQNFFAMEQKAMRGTRYKGIAVVPSLLYETFSDFGRSLARPAGCLLGVWLLFAAAYFKAVPATKGVHISLFGAKQISWQEWADFLSSFGGRLSSSMLYSASQILPFLSASREVKARAVKHLFADKVPDYLGWLNITEGLFAFIFLFLIGLALRNRFRI